MEFQGTLPFHPLEDPETLLLKFTDFVHQHSVEQCNQLSMYIIASVNSLAEAFYGSHPEKYNIVFQSVEYAARSPAISVMHVCYLKELLRQGQYATSLKSFNDLEVSKHIPGSILLQYCMYAAYHCLGNNDLDSAKVWYFSILYIPTTTLTSLHEEAYYSFLLLYIITTGKKFQLDSATSSNVLPLKRHMVPYEEFLDAYLKDVNTLRTVIKEHWSRFLKDNSTAFILFALEVYPMHRLKKWRKTFSSLKLEYIAKQLAISQDVAKEIIQKFDNKTNFTVANGEIFLTFDALDDVSPEMHSDLCQQLIEASKNFEASIRLKSVIYSKIMAKKLNA
ncbi:COP9/signalosome complex subunit Csn3 [Schizosaccharomyces pombe]